VPEHVGDGGLAGAARDGDRVAFGDQLGQHLGAGQDLDAHRSRRV